MGNLPASFREYARRKKREAAMARINDMRYKQHWTRVRVSSTAMRIG
jgi:hypothetical protein